MPRGLPSVEQKFTADVSGYLSGIDAMIGRNERFVASIDNVIRKIGEMEAMLNRISDKDVTIRVRYETIGEKPVVPPVMEQVIRQRYEGDGNAIADRFRQQMQAVRDTERAVQSLDHVLDEAHAANEAFNQSQAESVRQAGELNDTYQRLMDNLGRYKRTADEVAAAEAILHEKIDGVTGSLIDQVETTENSTTVWNNHEQAVARLAATYKNANKAFADAGQGMAYTARNAEMLRQILANTTSEGGVTRVIGDQRGLDALAAAAAGRVVAGAGDARDRGMGDAALRRAAYASLASGAGPSAGGSAAYPFLPGEGFARGTGDTGTMAALMSRIASAKDAVSGGSAFGAAAGAAMIGAMASHAGGGGMPGSLLGTLGIMGAGALLDPLLRARGGGGSPGILGTIGGGIAGGFGAISDMLPRGPDAAATFATVGAQVRRWYPAFHWAMMLTNEMLATVGPAVTALGMGGLVGMQGGEQAIPHLKAIFNTSESLGDSLGITAGQAMGLKTATLQNAQDLATGTMFELLGAGTNIMRAGAGGPFAQLGLNTDAMFARFAATLTQDFQKRGLGTQLGNLVTGGSGYAQQFGDVLANLGNTFLHVAPNLPGVGSDLLSTLTGATGLLSKGTGFLGGMLGPILAFEAGSRWGPALVGGGASAIGRAGDVLGRAGAGRLGGFLGTPGRAATATDVARGLAAAEGDVIAPAGIAGVLGGLSASQIGLIAGGAFLLNKGYTYKSPEGLVANQMLDQVSQLGIPAGIPQIIKNMQQLDKYPNKDFTGNLLSGTSFGNIGGGLLEADKGAGGGGFGQIWHGLVRATHGILQFTRGATGGDIGAPGGPIGTFDPTGYEQAQMAIDGLSKSLVYSLGTGKQVQGVWKGLTGATLDMGQSFDVATMAQLQLGSAFEKNGKLTDQAKTMIQNLQAGYQAMNLSGGQYGNTVAVQTAMAGLQHTQLAAVNQAWDQMSQMVQGGALSAAGYFGLLGGAPVASTAGRRAGVSLAAAAKGNRAFAQSLGSFITPGGAAAWNTLTSPQGIFPALEGQMNWLRTAQTLGSLTPGQTASMAGFDIAQVLPRLGHNQAALAMASVYAQQFGGPSFAPGTSGKDMAAALRAWTTAHGISGKQYNQLMSMGTVGMSGAGADAQQFVQQVGSGIAGALAHGLAQHGADLQNAFVNSIKDSKGQFSFGEKQLENYGKFMAAAGIPKSGAIDMAKYAAQLAGAGPQLQAKIQAELGHLYAKLKLQVDTSQVQHALGALKDKSMKVKANVEGAGALKTLQGEINALKSKEVRAAAKAQGAGAVAALNAEIAALHSKEVTITTRMITVGGAAPGISQGIPVGVINPNYNPGAGIPLSTHHAAGYKVPGYGGGDRHPALLEGGEAVVPKHLVAGIAPYLAAHRVPGFAAGGFVGQSMYGPLRYWLGSGSMAMWNPALYAQLLAQMRATQGGGFGMPHMPVVHPMGLFGGGQHDPFNTNAVGGGVIHPGAPGHHASAARLKLIDELIAQLNKDLRGSPVLKDFSVKVIDGIAAGMKDIKGGSAKIAQNLVNQIAKEVKYAQGVAQAAAYGQGYDPSGRGSGIFGGMNLADPSGLTAAQKHASPTGNIKDYNAYVAAYAQDQVGQNAPKSVADQMKDYLHTVRSFGTDIGKLRKQHLNKDVLAQIIAAGPQQGDQIAQSILGGQGGAKAINQLWSQINKASKKLGSQAAMGEFGGTLAPNLKSGTFINNNVSISISAGAGGSLSGMSEKELKQLIQKIQQELLKQAKRNNKTGVKQTGKSA